MSYTASFGTITSAGEPIAAPKPESPFRIGVLADFSGRHNRGVTESSAEIASRKLLRVDRDNLEEVMAKLEVQLNLPVGDEGATATLSFAALDDFHPDQIHDRVEQIADLYDDDEKSAAMNAVLHHADFQALESAWLGLDWLLRRAVKGNQVEVVLLDVSLAELAADLKASDDLSGSGLHQLLIDKGVHGPKGEPWAMLVGNYAFEFTGEHAELLGRIAKIASQTNAPFLTAAHSQVLDVAFTVSSDAAPAWQELRQLPEAKLLGVATPRFLLRLPFGENTKSIDKFSYEEMPRPPEMGHYLWANPALGCAALLAQAFHKQGWGCKPGAVLKLEELPIHAYTKDGEEEVTLAEAWLVRPQTEKLVKKGIMPFLCVRGQGSMQLLRFLSLADPGPDEPASELHGRWSESGIAPAPRVAASRASTVSMVGQMPDRQRQRAAPAPAPLPPREPAAQAPAAPASEPVEPALDEPAVSEPVAEEPAAAPEESAAAPETPPADAEAPPAEEEMDPDLAALLKQLE